MTNQRKKSKERSKLVEDIHKEEEVLICCRLCNTKVRAENVTLHSNNCKLKTELRQKLLLVDKELNKIGDKAVSKKQELEVVTSIQSLNIKEK
jgi:hypothetical protein